MQKKFIQKHHLNDHLATHLDQFPHQCLKCRREFAKEAEIISHKGTCRRRQYQCYLCKDFYCAISHFLSHMRVQHTGEKPFACSYCGGHYFAMQSTKKHMKNVHASNYWKWYRQLCRFLIRKKIFSNNLFIFSLFQSIHFSLIWIIKNSKKKAKRKYFALKLHIYICNT